MNKAFFTRKAVNAEELKIRTGLEQDKSYFVIEKIIELPLDCFEHFQENLLDDFDFIEDNVELQYVDSGGVWHCIGIMADGGSDIIIGNCEGYSYLRYSSYFPDCSELITEYKKYILSDKVIEQLMEIRNEGKYNMFSVIEIQQEALRKSFDELFFFIEHHRKEYSKFILTGER